MRPLLLITLLLTATLLSGCSFQLSTVEVGFNGGVKRIESGGENYADYTTGHWEQEGQWFTGGDVRFIFGRR